MKKEFTDINAGEHILITVSVNNKTMELSAEIVKHLKSNIAIINIDNTDAKLNFNGVNIDVVYTNDEGIPYAWFKCTIVFYQGNYLLQVPVDGGRRYNRRASFRVGVSEHAKLRVSGHGEYTVIVRDISLTGFAITDRKNELNLSNGTKVTLKYEDIGHELNIEGNVVRVQEEENYTIYGCVITKTCRDLTSYINTKQRKNKRGI